MHLTPQKKSPLPLRGCVTIRHPGQVSQSGTRAGIQEELDYIEISLDTGSHPPQADSSGMTIFPLSVLFQSYATNVLWFVAATSQALPTGERPSNQRCWWVSWRVVRCPWVAVLKLRIVSFGRPIRGTKEVRHIVLSLMELTA
jgi:hypothetical protein